MKSLLIVRLDMGGLQNRVSQCSPLEILRVCVNIFRLNTTIN